MGARKSIGKRKRFEILKRDGFRCRYCGANAGSVMLHVDHVIPVSKGGTDDPANLVTACAACNGGKSDVSLSDSSLDQPESTEAMLEHAEQMRAYLDAVRERERARTEIVDEVITVWCELVNPEGMPNDIATSIPYWIQQVGLDGVLEAVRVTAAKSIYPSGNRQARYFIAVVRNMRDQRS